MSVKPVPEGYHTLTPYLAVDNAAEAIEFYKKAFGAKEIFGDYPSNFPESVDYPPHFMSSNYP